MKIALGLMALGAVIGASIAWTVTTRTWHDPANNQPVRIEEDDPNWDCLTMGNRICGEGN